MTSADYQGAHSAPRQGVALDYRAAGVDYHVPFGGRKDSSYGPKEQGQAAREFFTLSKTSYLRSA